MTISARISFRDAVNGKCRECIYDPLARGTWREQVAACANGNCALLPVRPVPRNCMVDGRICPTRIAAVRDKLDA